MTGMTSRERVVASLEHREPDRVPFDCNFVYEGYLRLKEYLELETKKEVYPSGPWLAVSNPIELLQELNVDLCYIDPGFDVDVYIQADLVSFTKVWMGWDELASSVSSGRIAIEGSSKLIKLAPDWLGLSGLAGIKKRPESERVLRS